MDDAGVQSHRGQHDARSAAGVQRHREVPGAAPALAGQPGPQVAACRLDQAGEGQEDHEEDRLEVMHQVQSDADDGEVERDEEPEGEAVHRLAALLGLAMQVGGEHAGHQRAPKIGETPRNVARVVSASTTTIWKASGLDRCSRLPRTDASRCTEPGPNTAARAKKASVITA